MPTNPKIAGLLAKWENAETSERANAQSFLIGLCQALEVEVPRPRGTGYEFEFPVRMFDREGRETTNYIDLYKRGFFALETKHAVEGTDPKFLRSAFGQVREYVGQVPGDRPPYLLVLDIGRTLIVWNRWSGDYGRFDDGHRIDLRMLAENDEDIALLRDIWTEPRRRDPGRGAIKVTREVAEKLAKLAASLEDRGFEQERVARFLIRCVFTMFAEDTGLLQDSPFRGLVELAMQDPGEFPVGVEQLWQAMDEGRRFGVRQLTRFNGHFFHDSEALPLSRQDLAVLLEAAQADWVQVEPSIFGTLLVRALEPTERHKLGAEFTPREYVERLVEPTVVEPLRAKWSVVLEDVQAVLESGQKKADAKAIEKLRDFHAWLRQLRFLDPACGSGNFLYVTLHRVKQLELEVIREIEAITGQTEIRIDEVGPWQFHGIEIKPWAREIAELTLWIGFHQFWALNHATSRYPEPILQDTGTLEQRDAVLAWTNKVSDPSRDRPDPTPRIKHPVTGRLVPDPESRLEYFTHDNARAAEWPQADFIIGNPPYMGISRQRDSFGDGYVEALRAAYPGVPETADYVMYWWYRAAREVAEGRTMRAGLLTTNTITQGQNRGIVEAAEKSGARVIWAISDHPWNEEIGGAAVRVAMTVLSREKLPARKLIVDDEARVISREIGPRLNSDLSFGADVPAAAKVPLLANEGLCSPGFKLHGDGFILEPDEAEHLLKADPRNRDIIRPYRNGRDMTARPRNVFLIDFGLRSEEEARQYPLLFDLVRDRVKPERDANNDRSTREKWWRFGRNREELRPALEGLPRYIATVETMTHRSFFLMDEEIAPDNMLVCIALGDSIVLGVLTSTIHVCWALQAGGRLGVGNDPRYNKGRCFDPFPFPETTPELRREIGDVAEQIDKHRKHAIERSEAVTLTRMYNVVTKLREGGVLTKAEQEVHGLAACGVLLDFHAKLDALVARAYGWPWPIPEADVLHRLVELHDERLREEAAGRVRWLRPEFQESRFGYGAGPSGRGAGKEPLADSEAEVPIIESVVVRPKRRAHAVAPALREWPASVIDQMAAIIDVLDGDGLGLEAILGRFDGAQESLLKRHLGTLVLSGEIKKVGRGRFGRP